MALPITPPPTMMTSVRVKEPNPVKPASGAGRSIAKARRASNRPGAGWFFSDRLGEILYTACVQFVQKIE